MTANGESYPQHDVMERFVAMLPDHMLPGYQPQDFLRAVERALSAQPQGRQTKTSMEITLRACEASVRHMMRKPVKFTIVQAGEDEYTFLAQLTE